MPARGLAWTPLRNSRERGQWLRAAAVVSALVAALLTAAALDPLPQPDRWRVALAVGGVCGAAGAWIAWRASRAGQPRFELRVDADGAIWLRPIAAPGAAAPEAESRVLRGRPQHVSGRLITLGTPGGPVAIWHDSLGADAFRRLAAYARWHVERDRSRVMVPDAARDA